MASELTKLGIPVNPDSKYVWAVSDGEVLQAVKRNCLVVCGKQVQLEQGASLAIVVEGGRAVLYLHSANLANSRVQVPDAVMKVAKVVK